ncbi:Acetate CoA-transferase subunit alpha, partial [Haemophilus influenzae]
KFKLMAKNIYLNSH